MMKTTTYVYSFLAVLLLGFISCSNESELINPVTNQSCTVNFTIFNGVSSTRDAADANAGTDTDFNVDKPLEFTTVALAREKAISSLYAVVFNKEDDTFYKTIKVDLPLSSDSYQFNLANSGYFEFLLIANPDENLVKILTEESPEFTLVDLPSIIATQEIGNYESGDAGITNFLMISDIEKSISVMANTTLDLGDIKLIRLAARFDFYNLAKGFDMTEIVFTNRPAQSYLFEPMDQSKLLFNDTKEYTLDNGVNTRTSIGSIYSNEDITPNDCAFLVKGLYDGEAISKLIKFENRSIKRNHLYNIIITENDSPVTLNTGEKDDQLTYDIKVADWNKAETFGFVGDQLINKEAPSFEASGLSVVTTDATESTSAVVTAPQQATTVTILAISASSADSQLFCVGEMPSGWSIVKQEDGDIGSSDGKLTHKFTIEMTENTTGVPCISLFKLANVFNPDANVLFTLRQ